MGLISHLQNLFVEIIDGYICVKKDGMFFQNISPLPMQMWESLS